MESLGCDFELIFIVDGEGVPAWEEYLNEIHALPCARAILLGRNIGQHAAIRFGLGEAQGKWVYIMDCDLQDPPEIIPEVLAPLAVDGVDIVLTRRRGHRNETSLRLLRRLYNRLSSAVTGLHIPYEIGPVIALSSRAVSYVRMFREEAHILQILAWLEMPSAVIDYERQERLVGKSSYSFGSKLRHAVGGLSFSTARILSLIFLVSMALAVAAILSLIVLLFLLVSGNPPSGWLSLITVSIAGFALIAMLISFTGGLVIQGLNLARQRPSAIVTHTWNNAQS